MTFMEQVFAVFAVLTILGASVTYWRTHRRREGTCAPGSSVCPLVRSLRG